MYLPASSLTRCFLAQDLLAGNRLSWVSLMAGYHAQLRITSQNICYSVLSGKHSKNRAADTFAKKRNYATPTSYPVVHTAYRLWLY